MVVDLVGRNHANIDRSGMTFLIGTARFTGASSLEALLRDGRARHLTADRVFLNTGTRTTLPPQIHPAGK